MVKRRMALADMEDMKSFMPQEAVEACIASAQRIALAILTQPRSLRAECLATARRALEESALRYAQVERRDARHEDGAHLGSASDAGR